MASQRCDSFRMSGAERRATLAAVAPGAGGSVAPGSQVVDGRTDVAADTRARIGALLTKHGYVGRTQGPPTGVRTVDLIFDAMETPNNLKILKGAVQAAAAEDVDVVVGLVPQDPRGAAWARR